MYFDGSAHRDGAGAGVVFYTPEADILLFSFTLTRRCSNSVVEYHVLILGLETAVDMKQLHLRVYGDSKLVVNQLLGIYDVKKPELIPYYKYARQLMGYLDSVTIEHISKNFNQQADSLEDWRHLIIDYLNHGKLPEDPKKRVDIRRRAPRFIYYKGTLYRKLFDGVFLRCFGEDESMQAMEEAHSGICGAHQSGPKLHFRIKRMGYYWPTTVKDCIDFARRYQACQFHENFIHQPPKPLHPTVASWPFDAWGLDIVGSLPKSFGGHIFILAATNYFSKWAEAVFLREVKKENVVDFIRLHIIYRYGVPRYIITDNGKPFCNVAMNKLCEKFHFKQYNSSMYYAATNGLAEAFNKTLSTPYALVYGVEAVLPLECQIPSLRIAIQEGFSEENNVRLRLEELEALDEKRLETQQRIECYQARLSKAFNKHVRPRSFQIGELVLAVRRPIILTHGGQRKFTPKWDGPYVVREVYTNGSYKLVAEDGLRVGPINGKYLKRYYA
nr:protein NYNRIN-like [Coffea arabica]